MKKLVLYEFKNMWTQLTIVAVISLVAISTVFNFIAFLNSEVALTESGKKVQGIASYRAIKNELGRTTGVINQEYLDILTNDYNNSVEKQQLQNKIGHYLTKYTFSNYIINFAKHGIGFTNVNMDLDVPLDAEKFYEQYKSSVIEVILSNNRNNWFRYTDEHVEKIEERINDINTPLCVDYYSGLSLLSWQFGNQFWIVLVVTVFAVSSLFSKDSSNGISEVTLSSKYGRKKDMNARIVAGNIFAIMLYFLFLTVLLVEIGSVASLHGFNQSIQNLWYTCTYNINAGGGILIMFVNGLLTLLIVVNFVMLISMIIKRSKLSILVSAAIILFLCSSLFRNNSLLGQLSPISIATNFSSGIPNAFEIYFFVGDIVIPYTSAFPVLAILYLAVIRLITIIWGYRKYKLR